jgi:hypothetical protein
MQEGTETGVALSCSVPKIAVFFKIQLEYGRILKTETWKE